uniref:Si:ch211-214c7.5 n=1 Tax=Labrus bergylta TaxID=56723 RepID=A0A3Q3ERX7_9LABR|nr:UPF0575 protein C19orf67 homolog isoform X2 [Labrus bergylta]XP_020514890.1 UPF0575 protein C19orf67 homolog isoform X2 [Labrus bergylta]
MTDIEVQVDVQLTSNSAVDDQMKETLLLLADVALLPPCGDDASCSCVEVRQLERGLQSMQLQLQFLLGKADYLDDLLINRQCDPESQSPTEEVQRFLFTCQPYFNYVESMARKNASPHTSLPFEIHTRLLDFSQQLCDRLEQLVLTCASYNLICFDDAESNSISHFCIGQSQLGWLRLTVFRYCKLMPYLSRVDTGVYKRMRWNVERLREDVQPLQQDGEEREEEPVDDMEYYFLCCEDVPNSHADADGESQSASDGDVLRVWSIGQWVQVFPDTNTEDIYDWIMCEVPQGSYLRLLFLGGDEPSSCSATDQLLKLLLSRHDTE